jgi:hypothetical protein
MRILLMQLSYEHFEQIREHFTREEQVSLWIANTSSDPETMSIRRKAVTDPLLWEKLETLGEASAVGAGATL